MSEAIDPEQHPRSNQSVPRRRSTDEERAWSQLYAAIHQTCTAEEVIKQLDGHQQSKGNHLALYIRAKATLREHKVATDRNQRIAARVRQGVTFLVATPVGLLRRILTFSVGVGAEILIPSRREPARSRAATLKSDADFAQAMNRFSTRGTQAVAGEVEESRKTA